MVGLVRGGLLDLQYFDLAKFALEDVNEAVQHASANGGPLKLAVLRP
jgi:alcohol dehydrogenase